MITDTEQVTVAAAGAEGFRLLDEALELADELQRIAWEQEHEIERLEASVAALAPSDAARCAAALQQSLNRWPKALDQGGLQQIQAVFLAAGQTGQTLRLGRAQEVAHDLA